MKLKVLDLFSGYTIREDGAVTSRFGRQIKPQVGNTGYLRVELWTDGRPTKFFVHRLLAQAFIPNPAQKPCVNHIDGNKRNNDLSNLEWVSQSENQIHAYRIGLQKGYRAAGGVISDAHKAALCGSRWNYEKHAYHIDGNTFRNLCEAASHFGVSRQTILNRCKSERWPTWSKTIERR